MPSRFLFQDFIKRWALFLAYVAFLYASLPWAPTLWNKIIAFLGKTGKDLPFILLALVFVILNAVVYQQKKRRSLLSVFIILVVFSLLWLIIKKLEYPAEKVHTLEYGLLAFIIYHSLNKEQPKWAIYLKILLIGCVVGAIDEGIQYFLPNRVCDIRDVLLNAASVSLGEAVLYSLRHAG